MNPLRQMIAVAVVALGATVTMVVRLADKSQMPVPVVHESPAEVRVKAVERKAESLERGDVAAASRLRWIATRRGTTRYGRLRGGRLRGGVGQASEGRLWYNARHETLRRQRGDSARQNSAAQGGSAVARLAYLQRNARSCGKISI